METYFKLKLLNGPLCGHELHLPQGEFTIGGKGCDLLLPLEGGGNAMLEVSTETVSLTSGTACWIEGVRYSAGVLPPGKAIDLAGVHLVLAKADAVFATPRVSSRKSSWGLPFLIMFFTLLLAGLAGGVFWLVLSFQPPPPLSSLSHAQVSRILQSEPGLSTSWTGNDTLSVSGHCKDSIKLMPLIAQLQATGIRLHLEGVCNDELLRSIRILLDIYGYPKAIVTLDAAGSASIDGVFTDDTTELASALDKLPGLTGWHFSDSGAEELNALLPRLQAANLLNGLSASRSESSWLFSGQMDAGQQERLTAFISQVNAEANRKFRLRFIGTGGNVNPLDYLPAPAAGIGGNAQALYLQLTNGMRLLSGSPVKQGMRVIDITTSGVSLAGHQTLIFLPLHP